MLLIENAEAVQYATHESAKALQYATHEIAKGV
jgi:hypothetical protein